MVGCATGGPLKKTVSIVSYCLLPWYEILGLAAEVCISGVSWRDQGHLNNKFSAADATSESRPATVLLVSLTTCVDDET